MSTISALIITYNEEHNIRDCLESVSWVDELIIIDSYSDDKTIEISSEYTDKVYQRKFDDFSSQRNYGLEKVSSDWVLVIDADERITPELKVEIAKILVSPEAEAYKIPRKNYFLGKWIKHCGWYPDYTLRLFKKSRDISFEGDVHEGLDVREKVEKINNPLVHFTYKSLSHYIKKMDHYTTLWANEKYIQGRRTGIFYILGRPLFEFIKFYIFKKGFLLGCEGLILTIVMSYYSFLKYAKLWEKGIEKTNGSKKLS